MKHIIALLLENEPGALSRVVALFSARGYNIESLTVAPTEDPSLSRMTIVTTGSDEVIEQITKHLNRLIEVVKVVDLTEGAYTERELMLIKVRAVGKERDEMTRMTIVTTGSDEVIEQITKHLNRLIEVVKVVDLTEGAYTERELMLIKVRAVGKEREEMKRMADIFRGRIIDVTEKSYTIELTGDAGKLDAFIQAVDRASILETVRTGGSGVGRGERVLRV